MLYAIKKVIDLVPETAGFVKRAYIEQDFPTHDRDSTVCSALEINYLMKVANHAVDPEDHQRVSKAVHLYGLGDTISELTEKMVKAAAYRDETEDELQLAVSIVESQCQGLMNIEKVAEQAEALYDNYQPESDLIRLYAGAGKLNKEAAVMALNGRALHTGDKAFTKLASVIESTNTDNLTIDENRAIIKAVMHIEKQAGFLGDFYKDAFWFTKEAIDRSITVDLGSKKIPAVELSKVDPATVGAALGEDVAKLLSEDLMTMKAGIEALPKPEKELLARLC